MNLGMTVLYVQCSKKAFIHLLYTYSYKRLSVFNALMSESLPGGPKSAVRSDGALPGRLDSAHCGQRCPVSQEPEQQNSTVYSEKGCSLLCIQRMKLCTWGLGEERKKKRCEGNKTEWNGSKMLAKLKLHWIYTYWIFEVSWQEKLPSLQITEGLFYRINTLTEKS